jgi:hypothetical protein
VRAPARNPRWLNPAPCTTAKGMYLVGARKQELLDAKAPRDAVDVTWKRNGGEHAWSLLRISRVFDISSTKRRCPGCIGCEQTAAKRDGRLKNASTGTGLSDVDISHDQSSRWQKFAAVPEEIFEREVHGKTHRLPPPGELRSVRAARNIHLKSSVNDLARANRSGQCSAIVASRPTEPHWAFRLDNNRLVFTGPVLIPDLGNLICD